MGVDVGRYGGRSTWESSNCSTSSVKSEALSLVGSEVGEEGGSFRREKKL